MQAVPLLLGTAKGSSFCACDGGLGTREVGNWDVCSGELGGASQWLLSTSLQSLHVKQWFPSHITATFTAEAQGLSWGLRVPPKWCLGDPSARGAGSSLPTRLPSGPGSAVGGLALT